ncbi:MAG: hypothetical protein WCO55_04615 [Candidatus Falkowbacteria bacterium]
MEQIFLYGGVITFYLVAGFSYTHGKVSLFRWIFNKKNNHRAELTKAGFSPEKRPEKEKKKYNKIFGSSWWERLLCSIIWPCSLGDIPESTTEDKETRIIHKVAIAGHETIGQYYFFNTIFWAPFLVIMSIPQVFIIPAYLIGIPGLLAMKLNKVLVKKAEVRKQIENRLIEEKQELEAKQIELARIEKMLPAERLHLELSDKKTVISNYIKTLDGPDAVYNMLINELDGMIKKATRLVNDYSRFQNYTEGEFLTEKAIYAAAFEDKTIFTTAKTQITTKKETLSNFLEEVLAKVTQEIDKVSVHKNQEEKNVEALQILASLGREVRELDFKTRSYFDSEVLKIMNLLGSLMDDTLNQDKVGSILEQLRQDTHGLSLAQISLEGNDSYHDWQEHTIGFLDEVDQKIIDIKDKLHLPTAQVLRLQEQKIA